MQFPTITSIRGKGERKWKEGKTTGPMAGEIVCWEGVKPCLTDTQISRWGETKSTVIIPLPLARHSRPVLDVLVLPVALTTTSCLQLEFPVFAWPDQRSLTLQPHGLTKTKRRTIAHINRPILCCAYHSLIKIWKYLHFRTAKEYSNISNL